MRTSSEYVALQLAYDPERLQAMAVTEWLTTARFEAVFREMAGFGMLDLLFEHDGEVFVLHAVGVDTTVLATREGPALVWPSTLALAPPAAEALEEMVTPWLLSLVRGRGVTGEYVRAYRPSPVFALARERRMRGAVPTGETLPLMAPFVYARRFARGRDVYVGCAQGALASAVVGTVARAVILGGARDEFAERWYGRPAEARNVEAEVAIVDDLADAQAAGAAYVVTPRPAPGAHTVVIPIPVPQDHLFTFDPADAPAAATFAVRASARALRPIRASVIPPARGGSAGCVALVVRDDAPYAPDADTDAVDALALRLRAEGFEANVSTLGDARLREANFVHIFGGVGDTHVAAAADAARALGLPFALTVEPLGPYARYDEDASMMTLRVSVDACDRRMYLQMFDEMRLRFDDLPHERTAEQTAEEDRAFAEACRDACGIILSPGDGVPAFRDRFPQLRDVFVASLPALIAPEPAAAAIEGIVPAGPFLLFHGPLTRRSAFGYLLATLDQTPYDVVVAGPISEVDTASTLRRIAAPNVVFFPDPTAEQVGALYRCARAAAFSALRPAGAGRLVRAARSGTFPLVNAASPLARLVPPEARYDPKSAVASGATFARAMHADVAADAGAIGESLAGAADQSTAFRGLIDIYARAAAPVLR